MKKLTVSITSLLHFYAGCVAPPHNSSPEVTSTEKSKKVLLLLQKDIYFTAKEIESVIS